MRKILQRDIIIYRVKEKKLQEPKVIVTEDASPETQYITEPEKRVAQ